MPAIANPRDPWRLSTQEVVVSERCWLDRAHLSMRAIDDDGAGVRQALRQARDFVLGLVLHM
jgi:hypothetical protein